MRTLVVIQARLTSHRLPGKALLSLGGRPLVALVALRAARCGHEVLVATSDEPEDDAIASAVVAGGIRCFRGSLEDPLGRFAAATASLDDVDVVVRLTADNVVPDGDLIEELLAVRGDSGYVRTASGLPYGLSAEAFTVSLLRAAASRATHSADREHVTPWIRRATSDKGFVPKHLARAPGVPVPTRCTIDTLDDYVRALDAFAGVEDPIEAPWHDLLERWSRTGRLAAPPLTDHRENAIGQGPWVLGTVQLGMSYGASNQVGLPSSRESGRLITLAAECGATHLDTARAYGESELRIGRQLHHAPTPRVGVITKLRPLDDLDGASSAHVAAEVQLSVEQSLRALRIDSVDALLVHRWLDWKRGFGTVGDVLSRMHAEGVTRLVGVSLSSPEDLLEAIVDPRIQYMQLPFNLLDRRWLDDEVQDALAARSDVIVTTRSALLQGLLAMPRGARWPRAIGLDSIALAETLDRLARELHRSSIADLSLAYVRGHRFSNSVVVGAETAEQIAELADLFRSPPLLAEEIEHLHREIAPGAPTLVDPSQWRF